MTLEIPAATIAAHFWSNALERGHQPALLLAAGDTSQSLDWTELAKAVMWVVRHLQQLDVRAGSCVATQLPNSLDWIAIDLACQTLGIVHLAMDGREPSARVQAMLRASGAELLIQQPLAELSELLAAPVNPRRMLQCARQVGAGTAAQLLATSGTSGQPKLVTLSHRNLVSNAWAKLDAANQEEDDVRLNILPFAHAYARTCELSTWILSRCRLSIATGWEDLLERAAVVRPTLINLVPYLAERAAGALARDGKALGPNLRLLQVGGAGLRDELWRQLRDLGLPPLQGYGLTEAAPVVCSNRAGEQRCGTVGPAVAGTELRIDEQGLLWIRGPQVMLGYWRDAVATEEVLRAGWLCTGDLVEQGRHGLRIVGRQSQQIVLSTGYKVSPEQIEARLLSLPEISQVVVLGEGQPHITAWVWPKIECIALDFFHGPERRLSELRGEAWLRALAAAPASWGDLPRHALPKEFRMLPQPLSEASGTLTRKGSPMRAMIAADILEKTPD